MCDFPFYSSQNTCNIFRTNYRYVRELEFVQKEYADSSSSMSKILSEKERKIMFGNWKSLLELHSSFSRELNMISPYSVMSDPSELVLLLENFGRRFESPASDAVSNYVFSQPLLIEKMSESDGLFCEYTKKHMFEGLDIAYVFLSFFLCFCEVVLTHSLTPTQQYHTTITHNRSLLAGPMQRPLRYVLIVKDMIKVFQRRSNDQNKFKSCLKLFQRVGHTCEKKTSRARVEKIHERFSGVLNLAHAKDRMYITDALMEKGSHSSHLNPRRIYLFTDILLYTRILDSSKESVQGVLYLKSMRVEKSKHDDGIIVIHDESGSGKAWDFKPDKMMLTRWVEDLRKYIKLSKQQSKDKEMDCVSMSNETHPIKIYGSIYHRDEYGRTQPKPRLLTSKDRVAARRRSTFFGLVSSPFHSSSSHWNK